jgi:hypothetical protein
MNGEITAATTTFFFLKNNKELLRSKVTSSNIIYECRPAQFAAVMSYPVHAVVVVLE